MIGIHPPTPLLVSDRYDIVDVGGCDVRNILAGPLIELKAEHCQFKAFNGQHWGRVTLTGSFRFANGGTYVIDGFVGEVNYYALSRENLASVHGYGSRLWESQNVHVPLNSNILYGV